MPASAVASKAPAARAGHPRGALLLALAALALLAPVLAPAQALAPVSSPIAEDLLLPQGPEAINRLLGQGAVLPATAQLNADRALHGFSRTVGGRWGSLAWNPVTLTPRLVTGTGLSMGSPVFDRAAAEDLARAFVDRGQALWGLDAGALEVQNVYSGLGKWSVHFGQRCLGLPVIGSRFTVTMTDAGRICAFGGDLWPQLQAPQQARLTESEALARARAELLARGAAPAILGDRDRITLQAFGILPASRTHGYLVYRCETFFHEPLGSWLVDVDAQSGGILQIQNVLRSLADAGRPGRADLSGTISGDIEDPGWCFGIDPLVVPLLEIAIAGAGTDTTDADGNFVIAYGGTDPLPVSLSLYGPFVDVHNTNGPDALYEGTITPGEPFLLHWDDSFSRLDERDVFYHTNKAHEFIKSIDPGWSDLDFPLPANVNIQSSCNAYWDGGSINFFHEAGNCANTGRLGDVVHHEYGHGISQFLYEPLGVPADIGEGNSDVIGNYLTNESQMGRGFYLDDCEHGIRDSDNNLRWPDDLIGGSGHHDGQILAGFHWHARENLMLSLGAEAGHARAAQIWHIGRALGRPMMQPEQIWWTFIADDDDGNLDNGTPNYDDICPAAERHGFTCPERFEHVVIHHQAFQYAPAPGDEPIEITAEIYSFEGAMNPDSLLVYYREQGQTEFATALFESLGADDLYRALIPHHLIGSTVEYYIFAADELHYYETHPRTAPGDLHAVMVVTAYDPFEADLGWTVGGFGDNATQGIWERCDPNGAQVGPFVVQPEDDATPDPGALCWITGQYESGYPWFSDADGQTTLTSPVYNLSGSSSAVLRYHRWFQTAGSALGVLDIDVSNNGGLTWTNIEHLTGLNPAPSWVLREHDLDSVFSEPLDRLRLRLICRGRPNPSTDEAGLDEFVLVAADYSDVADDETGGATPRGALELACGSGNPLVGRGTTAIRFALPQAGAVRLRVLDLTGRVVQSLADAVLPAGAHGATWNGRSADGQPVGSGLYFIHLETPAGTRTARLLVAR